MDRVLSRRSGESLSAIHVIVSVLPMSRIPQATILVVDTDPESLFSIASLLIAQEHHVLTANSHFTAMAVASQTTLDLLITDTRLGDSSGIELTRMIRQHEEKSDLPVMYVSAAQTSGVIRRKHDFGAAFHLKKPIDGPVMIELVERALWMPHLIRNQIEQRTMKRPHVAFAQNPLANPFEVNHSIPGTPISF